MQLQIPRQCATFVCTHREMTSEKCLYMLSTPHTEMVYFSSTETSHCKDRRAGYHS